MQKIKPLPIFTATKPNGKVLLEERATGTWANPYTFNGMELNYVHARYETHNHPTWYGVDPLYLKYPEMSGCVYCAANPVKYVDPDGRDWFEYAKVGETEKSWNWYEGSTYQHKTGVDADGNDVFETLKGHQAVVVFQGSRNEKLGKGDNRFGKGALLAQVTVYGPNGADDIQAYQGYYAMASDFKKWEQLLTDDIPLIMMPKSMQRLQ